MRNRYLPHVLVLPEDDANRQIANGFVLDQAVSTHKIQILPEVGGWREVVDRFVSDYAKSMEKYAHRHIVMLIDFDGNEDRLGEARASVPGNLADRVFVLGVRTEPESLKKANLGSYETIGLAMARDCRDGTDQIWGHELLRHNRGELDRLREHVFPILFPV